MTRIYLLVLWLFSSAVFAQYSCPLTCLPPACVCASKSPPNGLTIAQTPMFVTLTFDDSVQSNVFDVIKYLLNNSTNRNGNLLFTILLIRLPIASHAFYKCSV